MGKLHLIIGPMFSGKTTRIIEISKTYKNPAIINYALDTRYHATMLSTHDNKMVPCIQTLKISTVICDKGVMDADAVLINEGQFFPDLYVSVLELCEKHNKTVYVCGLDGDFRRAPFGDLLNIIPLCDTIEKRSAICNKCKGVAIFTHRLIKSDEQVLIGSNEYIPVCRTCYYLLN
jgi:thymidine kinase